MNATAIKYYWDRTSRNWIVQALDAEGNQVGDAAYAANTRTLPGALQSMQEQHPQAGVPRRWRQGE